jgi:Ni/Co efflux regulator RcnB
LQQFRRQARLGAAALALALAAAPLAATPALARDHGGWIEVADHGHGRGHGDRGGPGGGGARDGWRGGGERGPPPGWSRGRHEGWRRDAPPDRGYYDAPERAPHRAYGVRRGGYLPPDVRGPVIENYGRYRLRPPPPGYTWVRVGNAFLLMNMASGQIFDVIPD